jgi:hypothetical protein
MGIGAIGECWRARLAANLVMSGQVLISKQPVADAPGNIGLNKQELYL